MERKSQSFLFICLFMLSCGEKKSTKESIDNLGNDSLYQNEKNNSKVESYDTIINGVRYAHAIVLSEKHIVAFEKYSKEHSMWQYMNIITNGVPSGLYNNTEVDYKDDLYYDDISPSPNKKYVYYCSYYTTLDINDEKSVVLKFSSGHILEIATGKIVRSLFAGEVGGEWTSQNQYIVNEEILFDPIKKENCDDEPLRDENVKEINIGENVFYITTAKENYQEKYCHKLTIKDKQLNILLQQCYDYTFIEIREQKESNILPLTFISGKDAMEIDFKYLDGDWIAESVVYYAVGKKQPDKKISINLKDFDFGDILEKWYE